MRKSTKIMMVAVLILSILVVVLGIQKLFYIKDQREKKAVIAEIVEQKDRLDQALKVVRPEDLDEETFAALQDLAKGGSDFSLLDGYDPDQDVTEAYFEQVKDVAYHGNEGALDILTHLSSYPAALVEFYMRDPDRYGFVSSYEGRESLQVPETLEEGLDAVPHLLQWDVRWGWQPYGNSTMYYAGCAPTCLSMVFAYLKQDASLTPYRIAKWSEETGHYVIGAGSAHSLLTDAANEYGVSVEGVGVDRDAVQQALDQGKLLILNMVPGHFTRTGHFIVATGMQDGKIAILDPNSNEKSTLWDIDTVLGETAAIWAYTN